MRKEVFRETYKEDELPRIANEVYQHGKSQNIWLFFGEMGAGKTTFIKYLGEFLKVTDSISSPTFGIVNEYHSEVLNTIYHFDFYRIENEEEAFNIGAEDYFYSGDLCLIEWPNKISSLLPEKYIEIQITKSSDIATRQIIVYKNG